MPASASFSARSAVVQPVEEELGCEGDHDEVIELAETGMRSGTMSRPSTDVAEGNAEQRLPRRRRRLVDEERPHEPGVQAARDWRAASTPRPR
jgi:hypothetical protein